MFNVTAATTAELVAKYNELNSEKPVKKFADRKTAERRVLAALESAVLEVSSQDSNLIAEYGFCTCPSCDMHLSNGVGVHNQDVNGQALKHTKYEFECLACGEEFGPALKPVRKADEVRSAAIAKSWEDADVKKARSTRHFVRVDGVEYRSVRSAFVALLLPLNEHIKFRAELKAEGSLNAYNHKWEAFEA
jgi:hypothetical protein